MRRSAPLVLDHASVVALLADAALTRTAVCARLGCHRSQLSRALRGGAALPAATVHRLAAVLGVPVAAILARPRPTAGSPPSPRETA